MAKQKSQQFAVDTTSDKTIQSQSLVQLTVAQLEAAREAELFEIAGGDLYLHIPPGSNNRNH